MPPENNPQGNLLKQIRTFQGDVADALGRQKESLVSIQQTEQFKRRGNPDAIEDSAINKSWKDSILLFLGGFFLILLGSLGAWLGYQEYVRKTAPPVISVPLNRFITPESTIAIDLTGATRDSLIADFRSAVLDVGRGEVRQVTAMLGSGADAPLVETEQFLKVLESRAPGSLVRAIEPLFMFGALGESRFIILKLNSFTNAFPGMLAWEEDMVTDLGPLLLEESVMKALPPASVFKDMVVKNKDVRVLEIASGTTTIPAQPVLVYSFFDNEILIITDKIESIQTIIDRLTREKLSR